MGNSKQRQFQLKPDTNKTMTEPTATSPSDSTQAEGTFTSESDQALKLVEEGNAAPGVVDAPKEETPPPAPAPAPTPAPISEIKVTAPTPELTFREQIEAVKAKAEPEVLDLIRALDKYVDVMAPGKPMTPEQGILHQYNLWDILHRTVELAPLPLFPRMWNIAIAYVREYQNGAFAISHSNRFTEHWGRNLDHLASFLELLDVLQISATRPKLVTKLKSIEKVISKTFTEVGRGRLTSFYN